MITISDLKKIAPHVQEADARRYLPHLLKYMPQYGITGKMRVSAFLAQILHESGSLRYVRELASGQAYDTGKLAERLGNTPAADGDGQKYKGRGLLQITGRSNYKQVGLALGLDLENYPHLLEEPQHAVQSACWWWKSRDLNRLADGGKMRQITRVINGGENGIADRLALYERALKVIS